MSGEYRGELNTRLNMPEEVKERFVLDLTKVILAFYEDEQHRQEFEEWRKKRHDASAD